MLAATSLSLRWIELAPAGLIKLGSGLPVELFIADHVMQFLSSFCDVARHIIGFLGQRIST